MGSARNVEQGSDRPKVSMVEHRAEPEAMTGKLDDEHTKFAAHSALAV